VVLPLKGRRGIQPVVQLTANGGVRANIEVGGQVNFDASIDVPEGGGKVVAVEWDFQGVGDFPITAEISDGSANAVHTSHAFTEPGTYFPVVRVTAQREGDPMHPYARVRNLSRVRVVVTAPSQ
jgi:hypothetical protein